MNKLRARNLADSAAYFTKLKENKAVQELGSGLRFEVLKAGTVYLAPNETHLTVKRGGVGLVALLQGNDRVSRHLPSVDVLFQSVAEACGAHALGVLLTGMGDDGARGLLQMRQKGAHTLGQDEATCVVYGMPRAAWLRGAVETQAPLGAIASHLVAWCGREA